MEKYKLNNEIKLYLLKKNVHLCLLHGIQSLYSSAENYNEYVKDIIKYKWELTDNPIKEKTDFKSLTLHEKVELILAVCEYRLDAADVVDQLKVCNQRIFSSSKSILWAVGMVNPHQKHTKMRNGYSHFHSPCIQNDLSGH